MRVHYSTCESRFGPEKPKGEGVHPSWTGSGDTQMRCMLRDGVLTMVVNVGPNRALKRIDILENTAVPGRGRG